MYQTEQPNLHLAIVSKEITPDPMDLWWLLAKLSTYALYQHGHEVADIAKTFGMAQSHLIVILDAFEKEGLAGLTNNPTLTNEFLTGGPQLLHDILDGAINGDAQEQYWFMLTNNVQK